MRRAPDARPELDRHDARLVARLAREYAPRPLGPAEREAFDAGLRGRLERRRRRLQLVLPALATATVAALVLLVGRGLAPAPEPSERVAEARPAAAAPEWEALLYGDDVRLAEAGALDAQALPADYAAIASLILER